MFAGDDGGPPATRGQPLRIFSSMSANLDSMVYPILFPRGDAGRHYQQRHNPVHATRARNRITLSQYYNNRLAV